MKLGFSDQRQLDAAEGWLELGNWLEANEELERISPEMRGHPSFYVFAGGSMPKRNGGTWQ